MKQRNKNNQQRGRTGAWSPQPARHGGRIPTVLAADCLRLKIYHEIKVRPDNTKGIKPTSATQQHQRKVDMGEN